MADVLFFDSHVAQRPSKELIDLFTESLKRNCHLDPRHLEERIQALFSLKHELHLVMNPQLQILLFHSLDFVRETGKNQILTLEKRENVADCEMVLAEVNAQGQLTPELLRKQIKPRTGMVSLSWAHPVTGVIQPIDGLIEVCKEKGIVLHVDISCALGKLYPFFEDVDYISFDPKLLRAPLDAGVVMGKRFFPKTACSFPTLDLLYRALESAFDKIDHYALEIARLRNLFESKIRQLSATILLEQVEKLPNTSLFTIPGVHAEFLHQQCVRAGLFTQLVDSTTLSIALPQEVTEEQILLAVSRLEKVINKLKTQRPRFNEEDARAKNMRVCSAKCEEVEIELLIDEEDGVIADCQFFIFGPPALVDGGEKVSQLLLRKNYMQARRLSAEILEKEVDDKYINLFLEVIDKATERCLDIPITDLYVAPPSMGTGERHTYPNWEQLSDELKKGIIAEVVKRDIQPYIEMDAGGVEVVKVEANRVTIAYSGSCTTCHSSTGATLDAIGNLLRHQIYPDLMVVPDLSLYS